MPKGRLPTSACSDSSEKDLGGSAETEVVKLQRQLRTMEREQRAYRTKVREQIRKQEEEIEKLQKEQEELLVRKRSRQRGAHEDTHTVQTLLEQNDMLDEELKKEKQSQKELLKEISIWESKLAQLRKEEVRNSETQKSQKAIRSLEYKLDRATTRLNEQMAKNGQVREEVKTLQIERARFQQLHKGLNKELQEVRKEEEEISNLTTDALDAGAEAQSKITMLREKEAKEIAQYNAEMKELERAIAHEYNFKEFMTTKRGERSRQDDHEMGPRQLSELKEQRRTDSQAESLDALKEAFEKIQAVTGEDNLDLLATRFIQGEEKNFALFDFVNEQNNEAKALRDQISQLKEGIEQLRVSDQQQEQEHRALLGAVQEQQNEVEAETKEYEEEANVKSNVLEQIKTGINSILSNMEWDRSAIEDPCRGSSAGITENNIMSYLGLIEQKTDELLTVQAFLKSKDPDKESEPNELAQSLLGQNPDVLQQRDMTQTAGSNVEYDAEESAVTDEEERPLSLEELRGKIMKGVLLKEDSAQQTTKGPKSSQQLSGRQSPRKVL